MVAQEQQAGEKILVAYVATNGKGSVDAAELRKALSQELPAYMVPATFVGLQKMPLSPNGKVDRKSLMQMKVQLESTHEYVPPQTVEEEQLVKIWEEVLQLDSIGVHDNLFESEGFPVAVQISSRIQRRLTSAISVRQIFEFPTISQSFRIGQPESSVGKRGAMSVSVYGN